MMTLVLAFMGVARAETIEIGTGTSTSYYIPFNSLYGYSFTEQVYPASEIGMAGSITSISFYLGQSYTEAQTNSTALYMKNVSRTTFSSTTDYETVTAGDMVYSGMWTIPANYTGWVTINLDTPFAYDGSSNLMVAMHEYTSGYSTRNFTYTSVTNCAIQWYSDSYNPDPYNLGSYSGSKTTRSYLANAQLDITAGGGGETVNVTIGDPTATTTNSYLPTYSFYNYSLTQQIYTADEIGTAGTINSLTMWLQNNTTYARNFNIYMKEVSESAFASTSAWVSMTSADLVGTGTLATGSTTPVETTFNLTTPFNYTGANNLVICFQDVTGSYSSGVLGRVMTANGNQAMYVYRDGSLYDPANPGVTGYTSTNKNVVRLSITSGGGDGGDNLHVKFVNAEEEEVIDSLNLGVRPIGAWMEPFEFAMYSEGRTYNVTVLDFTPNDGMFTVEGVELPLEVGTDDIAMGMSTNIADTGVIVRQFVAITEGSREAHIWPVVVEMYQPLCPDVWELACEEATTFPFVEVPARAHGTELHNDYTLPFPEIPEGYDAVYKLVFANDMMLNAEVTSGENGKVALYTEDFYGEGGPMAENYYQGPMVGGGGGAAAAPFEAQIGDGTNTTGYFPMYYLYNYSVSTQLFLSTEMAEAGATTAPMTSVSWYSESTFGYNVQNVSIWMANVADATVSSASPLGSTMTLVYQGNFQEVVGWNEFVFNQGSFAWDGSSNVLVMVQMNNGSWSSAIQWQSHTASFQAGGYLYQDSAPYNVQTTSYSLYTTTTRANTLFKSAGRNRSTLTVYPGTASNRYVPVYGFYTDSDLCSQYIIPAADLAAMNGSTITNLSYVLSTPASEAWNASFNVYMTEVSNTTPTELINPSSCTTVYTGTLNATGSTMDITLSTPYTYNGGNLLIGFDLPVGDNYSDSYFQGATCGHTSYLCGYAWGGLSYGSNWDYSGDFIPTTTFTYGGGGSTPTPVIEGLAYGPVITNAPIEAGTYYLVASSTDPDLEVTINAEAMPCPTVDGFAFGEMPADNEDEVEPASVTLQWFNPAYATEYQVVFGSTYYPEPNHPQTVISDWTPVTGPTGSFTVTNLWNNTNYFWYVKFRNGGACSGEGVESPHWGFTTHLNIPQNLRAADETVFNDQPIQLSWNAVVDRTFRTYFIYRDGVKVGETTVNNIGTTTFTDGPLAYNMNGYTYYVTAIYDEGESAPSNTVNVKVSGYSNATGINGYVWEQDGTTGIQGALVTINGTDEFGDAHTYTATTGANGYYNVRVYAGEYTNAVASKEGYQSVTTVHPLPFTVAYNAQENDVNFIMDENFDPVCAVIAEYYPDSLDPNSPYVKVYWGCGLPGSDIIEDFETGDFSLIDWQLDGTYPWSITTTNPYEGQYCMKSGGAGVNSVTSTMQVTVEIPRDGLMSFFGKISSESNYDFGHFYIDNVEKGTWSGAGSWGERKFDITAGEHTFKWSYTKDGSVNSNDDCFYVDYINFCFQPEPLGAGWHTYCESEFNNAMGSSVGTTRWAYEYPISLTSQYAGYMMTKVSLFSDNMYSAVGGNYTCTVYAGGNEPMAGTPVSTITVDVPQNLNAWVDFDLTTPVNVSGTEPLWVVWTANTTVSSWPAGLCGDFIPEGQWWNAGVEAGYAWEYNTYGTFTMRQYFADRSGRGFYSYAGSADNNTTVNQKVDAPQVIAGPAIKPAKGEELVTATCANPNAVAGTRLGGMNRSLHHYNIYRTNCYNDGPYTAENTVFLATVWVPDTVYIDVEWYSLPAGVYKWGVGAVYQGNRGELVESEIAWGAPVNVNNGTFVATTDPALNRKPAGLVVDYQRGELAEVLRDRSVDAYGINTYGTSYVGSYYWPEGLLKFNTASPANYTLLNGAFTSGYGLDFVDDYIYITNGGSLYKFDVNGNELGSVSISIDPRDGAWDATTNTMYAINGSSLYTIDITTGASATVATMTYSMYTLACNAAGQLYGIDQNSSGIANLYMIDKTTGACTLVGPTGQSTMYAQCMAFDRATGDLYWSHSDAASDDFMQVNPATGAATMLLPGSGELCGLYIQSVGGPNPGPNPGGNSNNLNELAEERESETVWSNCLDKDMWLVNDSINNNAVDVTVLLNSADSPEGTVVTFTNLNEAEQFNYPMAPVTLDGTGFYAWETFRKGDYALKIEDEGYYPITDTVSIWDATSLRYVMTEIIYGVDNLYVSRTGWAMWDSMGDPSNGQGGGNGGGGNGGGTFTEGFEGGLNGWNVLTVNTAGGSWIHSNANLGGYDYTVLAHNGTGFAMCYSFVDYDGAYDTDSYLYTPQKYSIGANSHLTFWADNANDSYPESFSVCVATADNPTASDFTTVWSGNAKANGGAKATNRHDADRYENWRLHNVDLSAYAGQDVYIAFHDVNYDMYEIWIDDVELTNGAKSGDDRHLEYYKVMCTSIDGEPIFNANTVHPFCQVATDELVEGEHYICKVAAVYSTGMSDWAECEWQYESCENYAGTVGDIEVNGSTISWEYPGGGNPNPQPGEGDTFSENFDAGIPAGWTAIDADGDGFNWVSSMNPGNYHNSGVNLEGTGHNASAHYVISGSWANGTGQVLYPDNYFVSPQVTLTNGSHFSFWACAQDANYPADHFGVFISDNGTSNWTMVNEWTMTAKSGGTVMSAGRDGQTRAQGNWYNYDVDLSAFAGQKYIAIRHFNCSDQFILNVDDAALTIGAKGNRAQWDLLGTFTAAEAGHYGIVSDGTYCYTSNWGYTTTHNFYKYDMQGNMIEGFEISGCGNLRDMTYDGQYFYGVATTNTVYCVDLAAHSVVSTFTSAYGAMRGITYDAERDGFWVVGNWSGNLALIDRTGAVQQTGPEPSSAAGLAYYKDDNNVEHVYCFGNADNMVYDWVVGSNTLNTVFNFASLPGVTGTAGGCHVAQYGDKMAFFGDIQQDPNLIGIYELGEAGNNPNPNPTPGDGNVIGAMIFADGEWEAFVPYPTNEYTYEGDAETLCVRMVYDGTAQLPDNNFYYAMSCEECVDIVDDEVIENSNAVVLFPNPTKGNVTIQAEGMSHITVVSVLGQVVYDAEVNADELVLNMAQFNAGMYMVRINTANGVVVKRVTVMQ